MRGRLFLLCAASLLPCAASLLPCAAVRAQPLPADPDPDALEIARALVVRVPIPGLSPEPDREERRLEQDLLSASGPEPTCDRADAECRSAAQAVAREYAPAVRRREELLRDRSLAYGIMASLPPERLHRLAAYLRTEEGRDFMGLWHAAFEARPSPERQREIQCRAAAGLREPWREARRAFRERTANLPRVKIEAPVIAPPAPQLPPPCPQ